jgi:hypothetical protein
VVEHRGAEGIDARNHRTDRARHAVLAAFGDHRVEFGARDRRARIVALGIDLEFVIDPARQQRRIEEADEAQADRRVQQRHHRTGAQVDRNRPPRIHPAHDGRAHVAPHRQRHGFADFLAEGIEHRVRHAHRIEPRNAGEAEFQCEVAEVVATGEAVLHHQPGAYQADQVAMCLGGGHSGGKGQVAQHHRRAMVGQHPQQGYANLD